jgi:hypothetical protein
MIPLARSSPGNIPSEVARWQWFLREKAGQSGLVVDGVFGGKTEAATRAFQQVYRLPPTGQADEVTLSHAAKLGYKVIDASHYAQASPTWPPRPQGLNSPSHQWRTREFGCFMFELPPLLQRAPHHDTIIVREDCTSKQPWAAANLVTIDLPQLRHIGQPPALTQIVVHKRAADKLSALWKAWEDAGLLYLVWTWEGCYNARYKTPRKGEPRRETHGPRASSNEPNLSNHAFGTAFDINAKWNCFGCTPPSVGVAGSVRELVPIANQLGWFWGGHFTNTPDGMHFELAHL